MREPGKRWIRRSGRVGVMAALAIGAGVFGLLAYRPWVHADTEFESLPRAAARRTDLPVYLVAGGLLESGKSTKIKCELEALVTPRAGAQGAGQAGSSTILTLVPDGTTVEKGQIICQLDSADYVELVRQQEITVQQARASKLVAQLNLEVAEVAVHEFDDGIRKQEEQNYRSQVALAESDAQRQRDRVAWTDQMAEKGYVSPGQVASEKYALQRAELTLLQTRGMFAQFERFTVPTTLITLQSQVEAAKTQLAFETVKLQTQEDRLEHLQLQVARCTIRAPHDGLLVYANDRDRDVVIEEGTSVRQRQDLFKLPDLSDMEVRTMLHETVVHQVQEGMPARVRVEALPEMLFEGHVDYVAPLAVSVPATRRNGGVGSDVKNYLAVVKLDKSHPKLRPGMSAQVEIATGLHRDALVIPPSAVTIEGERSACYVTRGDRVERRVLSIGAVTPAAIEVLQGISDGDQVVLDPIAHHVASSSVSRTQAEHYSVPDGG